MATIRTKLTPSGQMQLSRTFLAIAAIVVLLGIGLLALAQRAIPSVGALFAQKPPEPMRKVDVPESLKPSARPYAQLATPPPAPPVATPIVRQAPPVAPPLPPPPPPVVAAATPPIQTASFLDLWNKQQEAVAQTAQRQQAPAPPIPAQKPQREAWVIKPTDIGIKAQEHTETKESKERQEAMARTGEAASLIKPATLARPKYPLRTLYRSQSLAGRTLDEINSDIPGQVRVETTIPTYDKFHMDYEILPKGTLVIAEQEGKPEFGQSRLALKVAQVELPSGEIFTLKSALGSEQGANGVTGKVNAHIGKLLLATGISAVLNIGVRSAAGTPGQGYYFTNPVQQAGADIGQSVQRDAQGYVDKLLRVPPTIVVRAGTPVTINLGENVTFSRAPTIVR